MTATEQINDFTTFAMAITKLEGEQLSLDEIYVRWWSQKNGDEDLTAVQQAHDQYESGERGEDAMKELADFRAERAVREKS